jgi:hypothetical protein
MNENWLVLSLSGIQIDITLTRLIKSPLNIKTSLAFLSDEHYREEGSKENDRY